MDPGGSGELGLWLCPEGHPWGLRTCAVLPALADAEVLPSPAAWPSAEDGSALVTVPEWTARV